MAEQASPPRDDGELVAAALAYATLALMQDVRPEAHLITKGPPTTNSYFWPPGWPWEPADTPRENLIKARNLLDAQLAEPGQAPAPCGYPDQAQVATWRRSVGVPLSERTLGLLRAAGTLREALLERQDAQRGSFAVWSIRIRDGLGDVLLDLLDIAEAAGFDLETATALRWHALTEPKDVA